MVYSKGLMLYADHKAELDIPSSADFIIAVASHPKVIGDNTYPVAESGFNTHVQNAYNANIPCIAMLDIVPSYYIMYFSLGMADQKWPSPENDPHIKVLDNLLGYSDGKIKYAVHGIMIDSRFSVEESKTISMSWISYTTNKIRSMIESRYGLPVYVLTDSTVDTVYSDTTFFAMQTKLSTHCKVPTQVSDDEIPDPTGKPYPNWQGIKFWWYGSSKFNFLSGTASSYAPILQYRNTKESLYKELNFTPRDTEDVGDTSSDTTTSTTTEPNEISISSSELISVLKSIDATLKEISGKMPDLA